LIRNHRTDGFRVGHEERVLVGCARECNAIELAYSAVCAIAACDVLGNYLLSAAIRIFDCGDYMVRLLIERRQFRVPMHGKPPLREMLAHDAFVVILAQHQDVRKRTHFLSHFIERNPRSQSAPSPHVRPITGAPQFDCALSKAELRVDLECARVHRHRSRLLSRSAMTIDDRGANTPSSELVGKHQTCWAGSNYENISHHLNLL